MSDAETIRHKSWQEQFVEDQFHDNRPKGCVVCDFGDRKCVCPDRVIPLSPTEAAAIENVLAAEALGATVSPDMVNLPKHYARFKIEPIRFIVENGLDWFQGNIVKYVLRHDAKNGLEDLRKAERYLKQYIAFKQGDENWWRLKTG